MRKQFIALLLVMCLFAGAEGLPAYAEGENSSKPLEDIFYQSVILPYDYQGKVFIQGDKTDLYEDYKVEQRNGRVLVPIRLMGYLAGQSGKRGEGTWDVIWNQKTPDVVLINNSAKAKSIKFTVNSKTMLVNKKPVELEVPPQKINGRVVLPLRDAAVALEKRISWLDGLIVIGDTPVDVKHARTLSVKDAVKAELADSRKPVNLYTKHLTPITKHGNYIYYYKSIYGDVKITDVLYRKADGQKETKVQLPGKPSLNTTRIIGDELYYVSTVKDSAELHAYHFAKNQSRKVCSLGSWRPSDGWLSDIRLFDGELYVNLHSGDNTMGSDTLYRVEKGSLKEVLGAKSLIQFVKSGKELYYTDFMSIGDPLNNLYRMDMMTGKEVTLGEPGFAYGIHRDISDGGIGYSSDETLHLKDGYLYALGYKDEDPTDQSAVYKISLADQTQVKLTSPARNFWVKNDRIYYIDAQTGFLYRSDLNGENPQAVAKKAVFQVSFHDGFIYYLANEGNAPVGMGVLYRYDIKLGKEVKLSDQITASYIVNGGSDVYYVAKGYKPGIYKVDRNGRNVPLVRDDVYETVQADKDKGIVYSLVYKEGIYAVK
ncbi:DUF5050 domain-containing protein [Paenibacillus sp. A14]|uniref:DUF5050 domain-containing protein n=1 Tax=Paenibacillus sp. A14 TaxID=3119820 RepID=UPI002FE191EF